MKIFFNKPFQAIALLCLLAIAAISGCKEDINGASWDVGVLAPILKTTLTLENATKDSILRSDSDGAMRVVYERNLEELFLDTLLTIPDTTFKTGIIGIGLTIQPNAQIPAINQTTKYDLKGAELTDAIARSGYVGVKLINTVSEKIFIEYDIPSATLNGQPFHFEGVLPAAPNGGTAVLDTLFDVSGYVFDLRGQDSDSYNRLISSVSGQLDPDGGSIAPAFGDTFIYIENSFIDIVPEYVRGYFGQQSVNIGPDTAAIAFMKKFVDGELGLDSVTLSFAFSNGIGVDARTKLNEFTAFNTRTSSTISLNHDIVGTSINISRSIEAYPQSYIVTPTVKSYVIDNSNSNLKEIFESLPDEFRYSVDFELNPLGNISTANDFYYHNHQFQAQLKLEVPLNLYSNNLTLVDTLDFNGSESSVSQRIQSGNFRLIADNSFPLEAKVQLMLLNESGSLLDSLVTQNTITAPSLDGELKSVGSAQSTVILPLSVTQADALNETRKVLIKVSFTTPAGNQLVKIYNHYKLDVKLIGDFNYTIGG